MGHFNGQTFQLAMENVFQPTIWCELQCTSALFLKPVWKRSFWKALLKVVTQHCGQFLNQTLLQSDVKNSCLSKSSGFSEKNQGEMSRWKNQFNIYAYARRATEGTMANSSYLPMCQACARCTGSEIDQCLTLSSISCSLLVCICFSSAQFLIIIIIWKQGTLYSSLINTYFMA